MHYRKLETSFEEICKEKSITEKELIHKWKKDYVKKNMETCKNKYYLKYDYEKGKDELLIFGDDGEFYEMSDGSTIEKRTFEKMFRTEDSHIEVNPNEFFYSNSIFEVENKRPAEKIVKPVNSEQFLNSTNNLSKLVDVFKNVDIDKIKFHDDRKKINMKDDPLSCDVKSGKIETPEKTKR